jgi:hypothetical protein
VFLGHKLSASGFEIDNDKVADVMKFGAPTNATDARSFLGLTSYLSDYIPNFTDLVRPMWDAVKAKPFAWGEAQQRSFEAAKRAITDCTTKLGFFEEARATVLYTDASPYALGGVLTQESLEGKRAIISFASKMLTKTEMAYPQIQKEALAVVWGCERFYYYVLGRKFTIRTDVRGLAYIFDREKTTCKRALNRAEGWALRLAAYDYDIEWIKGKSNIADPPSRLSMNPTCHEGRPRAMAEICVMESASAAEQQPFVTFKEVREETSRDEEFKEVLNALATGVWPRRLAAFAKMEAELKEVDGALTRLGALAIPKTMRGKVLAAAHTGHPGRSAMISIMKGRVWLPTMPSAAKRYVEQCEGCNLTARASAPVAMLRSALPEEP